MRIVVTEEAVEKPEFDTEKGKTDARADGTPEARKGWAECPPFHCEVGVQATRFLQGNQLAEVRKFRTEVLTCKWAHAEIKGPHKYVCV